MQHERGAVPGPTSKEGERATDSAEPGEQAATQQASPPAPLGYGEEASENLGSSDHTPNPPREKYRSPSEGESETQTSAPHRGGGYLFLPGEDS